MYKRGDARAKAEIGLLRYGMSSMGVCGEAVAGLGVRGSSDVMRWRCALLMAAPRADAP